MLGCTLQGQHGRKERCSLEELALRAQPAGTGFIQGLAVQHRRLVFYIAHAPQSGITISVVRMRLAAAWDATFLVHER